MFVFARAQFVCAIERRTDHLGPVALKGTRQRIHRIRAHQVVLATGAIERPLVFANNDLPGIMLAHSVSTYINRFAVVPGQRCVVMTTNDSGYQTALDIQSAGRTVVAVVDSRHAPAGRLVEMAKMAGIQVMTGYGVIEAQGGKHVTGAIECDAVAMSGGWSPVVHLWSHCGGKLNWDFDMAMFRPDPARPPLGDDGDGFVLVAGTANRAFGCRGRVGRCV